MMASLRKEGRERAWLCCLLLLHLWTVWRVCWPERDQMIGPSTLDRRPCNTHTSTCISSSSFHVSPRGQGKASADHATTVQRERLLLLLLLPSTPGLIWRKWDVVVFHWNIGQRADGAGCTHTHTLNTLKSAPSSKVDKVLLLPRAGGRGSV